LLIFDIREVPNVNVNRAGSAAASTPPVQGGDGGANPTPALHLSPRSIEISTIPHSVARALFERHHYLHSMPAGTRLCFGAFVGDHLLGALALGVGPINARRLVDGATQKDCLTLTRLWLDDRLPRNSESRVLGLVLRALRRHTQVKFLLSYADPAAQHIGFVYQATNWLYTGRSEPQPLLDLGDGIPRHTRSVSSALGTHSTKYLRRQGLAARTIPQPAKHRYVFFVDPSWRDRLLVPVLPYPKRGDDHGDP
jgi:hypothetical protein